MTRHWQLQEAKQRFSELIRSAEADGPQFVSRRGDDVAVVIDIREYRRLQSGAVDFKDFLRSGPDVDLGPVHRAKEPGRVVELTGD